MLSGGGARWSTSSSWSRSSSIHVSPRPPNSFGHVRPEEPRLVKLPLPVAAELVELGPRHVAHDRARGPVRRQVGREPGAHLGAKRLLLGSEPEVHRSSAAWNRAPPVYSTRSAGRDERAGGSRPPWPGRDPRRVLRRLAPAQRGCHPPGSAPPEGAGRLMQAQTLKIEHARYVLTLDGERRIIQDGSILIEGQRISRVGKAAELARRAGRPHDRRPPLRGDARLRQRPHAHQLRPRRARHLPGRPGQPAALRLQAPDGDDRGGGVPHDAARPRGAPQERHRRASSIPAAPSSRTPASRPTRTPASA